MQYRILGRTGLKLSAIGIGGVGAMGKYGPLAANGTAAPPSGEPKKYRNVRYYDVAAEGFTRTMARAEQLGVNFLDTAPSYGDSEAVFGHYLKDRAHREKWIVCTKVGVCGSWGDGGAMTCKNIFDQCDRSLQQLGIDQIDLLLIHSLDQYGQAEQAVERVLRPGGMVEALQELKTRGKIRFFGVSGQLRELICAAKTDVFDVLLTYNSYNLLVRDAAEELLPIARRRNLGVILGGAYYQGLLTGDPEAAALKCKEEFFETNDPALHRTEEIMRCVARLRQFAGGSAADLRRLAMRFCLSQDAVSVVVTGIRSPREVEENVAAVEAGALDESEQTQVARLLREMPVISWKAT